MEHVSTPRKSVWRQTVPQAISNSAMVAMVTLCYFGLVSPTLDLVQTAQLVQANVRLNNDFGFAYTVVDPSKASALNSQIKSVVLQQPIATATSAPATLQLVTTTNGSIKEVVAVNAPTSPVQSGPSVSFVDPVKVKEEVSIAALNAVYTESDYKPSAEPSLNPGNPLSSDSPMPMEPVLDSISAFKVDQLEQEQISIDKRLEEIETAVEFYRVAVDTPQFANRTQDELKRAFTDLLELYDEKDQLEEKSLSIGNEIQELTGSKDGYIPTGQFVTTPNNNGMNNYDGAGLGAPTVNTQNNGVNSSRSSVSTPKPPITTGNGSSSSNGGATNPSNPNNGNPTSPTNPNQNSSQKVLHQAASDGVIW